MSKSAEAVAYVKKAEKCMKTSLLKWSTDAEGALSNYTKAAECYKNGNDLHNAILIYKKIADMHLEADNLFYCAKALEDAANLYKVLKDYKNMMELIMTAGEKLRINGNSDSACQLAKRTAKVLEEDQPKEAAKLYVFASDAAQDKDSLRDAGEFAGLAAKLFIRINDMDSALEALKSKVNLFSQTGAYHEAGKGIVCQVLIHLYNNDFVMASKTYNSCIEQNSFGTTEDCSPVNQLLDAYDRQDAEEARRILKTGTFMYLENDFVKLARSIKFPEGAPKRDETAATDDNNAESYEDIN